MKAGTFANLAMKQTFSQSAGQNCSVTICLKGACDCITGGGGVKPSQTQSNLVKPEK
jgi:hypothetical protein